MKLSDFLTGKHHHKAERVDSVYLSKVRIAKKKLLQETNTDAAEAHEADATGVPANEDLIGAPEKKEVIPILDTASPGAEDASTVEVEADGRELEVGEHQAAAAGLGAGRREEEVEEAVKGEEGRDKVKGEDEDDDAQEVVSQLRKDSVMLARERLSGARSSPADRLGKHEEGDGSEADDVITEIVDDETVNRKRASMDSSGRQSNSWSQPRPHSAMHNSRHSADGGSHSVHFGVKRTQSGGANRGTSVPRGDARQRRASTGEGVPLDPTRRQPRKSETSLLRFLKQAFLPSSSSSSHHYHHHHHASSPSSPPPAAASTSHPPPQPHTAPGPLLLQHSSGLASESSNEPAGCSVPEGGGSISNGMPPAAHTGGGGSSGNFLTPPNTPSQVPAASGGGGRAKGGERGGSETGGSEDQGAVAAFFSKIGRATFKRRNSKELAQAEAPAEH